MKVEDYVSYLKDKFPSSEVSLIPKPDSYTTLLSVTVYCGKEWHEFMAYAQTILEAKDTDDMDLFEKAIENWLENPTG